MMVTSPAVGEDGGKPVIPWSAILWLVMKVGSVSLASIFTTWHWLLVAELRGVVQDYMAAALTIALGVTGVLGAIDIYRSRKKERLREQAIDDEKKAGEVEKIRHENRMQLMRAQIEEAKLHAEAAKNQAASNQTELLARMTAMEQNQERMREGIHKLRNTLSAPDMDRKALGLILDRLESDLGVVQKLDQVAGRIEQAATVIEEKVKAPEVL
jgi:hypothetical protein